MNRHDILLLQQIRGYPALSITLPTHRTAPDNKQDAIRLKNLSTTAGESLLNEIGKREIAPLLNQLDQLINTIDHRYNLDGIALFVNRDFGRVYKLPFPLKERISIDETFATRDLVFALNRTPRYWTLVLSEKPTRLFECTRDSFTEITEDGFPLIHEGPGGEAPLPGGYGIRKSAYRDERHRQFFRQVDSALKPFMTDDALPLAVVGVDRFLSFFNEITSHKDSMVTTLTGSHDKTPPHQLADLVWPLVKRNIAEKRLQVLQQLDQAISERKFASTIGEVWRLAKEGRGRILIVEQDFHFPAMLDETGLQITPAEDITSPGVIADAVDEIIEEVISKQGQVVFVDNGLLETHQRISLILRY